MSDLAWHWTAADKDGHPILRDGRRVPPTGEWLRHDGPIEMCEVGLHFSRRIVDGLHYAPGCILHRVEVQDIAKEQEDKGVCRARRSLAHVDMLWPLIEFSEACAAREAAWAASEAREAASEAWAARAAAWAARAAASEAAWAASAAGSAAEWADRAAANAADKEAGRAAGRDWQEDTLRLWWECMTSGYERGKK